MTRSNSTDRLKKVIENDVLYLILFLFNFFGENFDVVRNWNWKHAWIVSDGNNRMNSIYWFNFYDSIAIVFPARLMRREWVVVRDTRVLEIETNSECLHRNSIWNECACMARSLIANNISYYVIILYFSFMSYVGVYIDRTVCGCIRNNQ